MLLAECLDIFDPEPVTISAASLDQVVEIALDCTHTLLELPFGHLWCHAIVR
jgi:hypothetical protein